MQVKSVKALIIALMESPEQSETISRCLKAAGHDVHFVENFSKAKTILQKVPCDLILSDVHLQNGGNVFDFLKWCKNNSLSKPIPFVRLSLEPSPMAKYLGDGVRYAAKALGAAKYISMETFDSDFLLNELAEFFHEPELIPVFGKS
jgi:CheY-like chemotaxis protein